MAAKNSNIKSPVTQAFRGAESLEEEKAEERAVKRSGSVAKAMAATKGRKVGSDRKASGRH